MIIFDEKQYVADIIQSKAKPPKMATKRLIIYLCRYYYDDYKESKASTFARKVISILNTFNFTEAEYEEYKYYEYTKDICKRLLNGNLDPRLKEIKEISVTKTEVANVRSCDTDRQKKLLFTFYVLAKTYNDPTGWVNYSVNDIFELANIKIATKDKILLIKQLVEKGFIQYNHIINKNSYQVIIDNTNSENELIITKFKYIGNQWLVHENPKWMICDRCGRIIKRHSNRHLYCKNCYDILMKNHWKI